MRGHHQFSGNQNAYDLAQPLIRVLCTIPRVLPVAVGPTLTFSSRRSTRRNPVPHLSVCWSRPVLISSLC